MSARANARCIGMLLVVGSASTAGALDPGKPAGPASDVTPALTLPIFLDAARLPALQAAWRTRCGAVAVAAPIVAAPGDQDAGTIVEARQTLTRAEQVTNEAVAVRERAEALSRRFAISANDGGSAPAPDPEPVPVASPDAVITERASITPEAAPAAAAAEAAAEIQNASATASNSAEIAPASMLGGPGVEQASAADPAPVIEDMATKPVVQQAKRPLVSAPARKVAQTVPESRGFFASIFSGSGDETAPKPDEPDKNLPVELRSFGWNTQP
jgi:hypothetical protein